MSWLRDIDRWFMAEVLPSGPAYVRKAALFCGAGEADDLVQEAYARVLAVADYRAIQHPRAFVLTIVQNLAIERLRRAQVVSIDHLASIDTLVLADPAPDAFSVASAKSDLDHLLQLIDALPPQCARVVRLRKIDGLSPGTIAERLSISVSTVEKHLAKGLSLLTTAMRSAESGAQENSRTEWTSTHKARN
ncbi:MULTISPECIES: RNA polymerase sigma factor [unclassified Sphingomonas]|uniref:RNA polymerase sigma factor n=1 Tax=unclassified Sphingomonas TaxID=196159 RepID=UPI0006F385B7|nr:MULTISPECIES: RNA polymerase sigma factor [unclassified Sphingomonas]KQN03859.1 RNA polymerase subunit sigma-24 [Sphingomonas sp. Leaf25]